MSLFKVKSPPLRRAAFCQQLVYTLLHGISLMNADCIVVLEKGQIKEARRHEGLLLPKWLARKNVARTAGFYAGWVTKAEMTGKPQL